jgi:hypothetical protein
MPEEGRIDLDIILNILNELHYNVNTLRACSLVSHIFLTPSQKLIFSVVNLKDSESISAGEQCDKLWGVLQKKPQFLIYIRELCLSDGTPQAKAPHWVAKNPSLPGLLSALKSLRSLSLISEIAKISWERFSGELQTLLVQLLCSPSLVTLRLWNIHSLPLTVLAHTPQLKALSVTPTFGDLDLLPGSEPALKLEVLEIVEKTGWFVFNPEGLLYKMDLSGLRVMSIVTSNEQMLVDPSWIMTAACATLESFSWTCIFSEWRRA